MQDRPQMMEYGVERKVGPAVEYVDKLADLVNITYRMVSARPTQFTSRYLRAQEKEPLILENLAILRVVLYTLILIMSVVGNVMVILTIAQNKRMRTVTNVFLLNLSLSDLLLCVFCIPFTLVGSLLKDFIFGEAMCRMVPFVQAVSVSVSAWTLVAISLERFFAICRPLHSRQWQTTSHSYRVICFVWIAALIHTLPIPVLSQLVPLKQKGKHKCREVWPSPAWEQTFTLYLDMVLLILPSFAMTSVYTSIVRTLCKSFDLQTQGGETNASDLNREGAIIRRERIPNESNEDTTDHCPNIPHLIQVSNTRQHRVLLVQRNYRTRQTAKRKVIVMLTVIVAEFFFCWTPLYVINTWSLFNPSQIYSTLGPHGISFVQLIAFVSCCCNPITYCFMYRKFRESFKKVLFGKQRPRWNSARLRDRSLTINSYCSIKGVTMQN